MHFHLNVYKADKKYGLTLTRDQNYFPFEVRHVCYLSKGNHSHFFRLFFQSNFSLINSLNILNSYTTLGKCHVQMAE